MRLATIRTAEGTRAIIDPGTGWRLTDAPDAAAALSRGELAAQAAAAPPLSPAEPELRAFATLVPRPGKFICVGQNYRKHIEELGNTVPEYPTLFAKFSSALIGAGDDIALPRESSRLDWEAELAIVIGRAGRRVEGADAAALIAGFTVANDISARDWQRRTSQWLQGKSFDRSTPVGPWMVGVEELGLQPDLRITTTVDGVLHQDSRTGDMLFSPVEIVAYVSQAMTLEPGDIILTGTPSGVGAGMTPPEFLAHGQEIETTIEAIGTLRNRVVAD